MEERIYLCMDCNKEFEEENAIMCPYCMSGDISDMEKDMK